MALEEDVATEAVEEPVEVDETVEVAEEDVASAEASIDELMARISDVESKAGDFDAIRHDIQSQLGRVQGIQSAVDRLSADDASATYRARVEQLEENIGSLQELILGSEFVDDNLKISMREQQLENRLRTLEKPPAVAQPAQEPNVSATKAMWSEATTEVARLAQELGYDPASIPATVWSAGLQTGSPIRAVSQVSDWVKEQVAETENVSKAAESKRAANGGSPPRAGSTPTIDDLVRTYGEGKDISVAEKQRVMQHLGIRT
jgi:uncharacterized protein YukE